MISLSALTGHTVPKKILPAEITSLDLLKAIAVVLMIIDHVGQYFYPEILWLRAIGRIGFPVWFFMAGYAAPRGLSPRLVIGGLILVAANYMIGIPLFPLNALFTIIAIRLLIHPLMKPVEAGQLPLTVLSVFLAIGILFTSPYFEYGTMALITAIFGYLVRNRDNMIDQRIITYYMVFSLTIFLIMQKFIFGFDWVQMTIVIAGTLMVRLRLLNLRMELYPDLTARLPGFMSATLKFMGRRTLEIYVVHLVVFKFIALAILLEPWKWQ